jgi:signal transduction histidine kinase
VDRLLDIAKIAAGRLEIHAEPLVLRPFVLNVASEMESLVSERGLALSIGVGPSLPRIRTDQTHLRQILINLIGNAVKYTPSGVIQVRAKLIGNGATSAPPEESEPRIGAPPDPQRLWVALQVSDTGVGIAPGDLERIFDEFEQVNAGARTDSARRGTGLGLAISRRLARLLGGDLTVVSEPGRGSVFTVWLPLEATDQKTG